MFAEEMPGDSSEVRELLARDGVIMVVEKGAGMVMVRAKDLNLGLSPGAGAV